jgi:hypothetical protein
LPLAGVCNVNVYSTMCVDHAHACAHAAVCRDGVSYWGQGLGHRYMQKALRPPGEPSPPQERQQETPMATAVCTDGMVGRGGRAKHAHAGTVTSAKAPAGSVAPRQWLSAQYGTHATSAGETLSRAHQVQLARTRRRAVWRDAPSRAHQVPPPGEPGGDVGGISVSMSTSGYPVQGERRWER